MDPDRISPTKHFAPCEKLSLLHINRVSVPVATTYLHRHKQSKDVTRYKKPNPCATLAFYLIHALELQY